MSLLPTAATEFAEKFGLSAAISLSGEAGRNLRLAVCLKAYPDTKPEDTKPEVLLRPL
jgi:hypothetical protein